MNPLLNVKTANVGNALAQGMAIGQPIANSIRQNRQMEQSNALAEAAAGGDRNALLQLATLNPRAASAVQGISNADSESKRKGLEMMYKVAAWADTPEKWEQGIGWLGEQTGSTAFEQYRTRFADREMFLTMIEREGGSFGQPVAGIGPDGKPALVQFDKSGRANPTGYAPQPKAPLVNVNTGQNGIDYGKPPTGFAWARGADGQIALQTDPATGYASPVAVPVAGGPEATERAAAASAAEEKQKQKVAQAGVVAEDIDRAIAMVEGATIPITGAGSLLSSVPGTPAHDLSATLDTIKANIGFDKLQAMREASPTGGALGSVSERENELLQSVHGSLMQSQGKEDFLYNLRRLKDTYNDIVHGPGNGPGRQGAVAPADFSQMNDQDFSAVPLTDENAGAWLEEARKRGLAQ